MWLRIRVRRLHELIPAGLPANANVPVRLHHNQGGYCGERIVIPQVLQQLRDAAVRSGWTPRELTRQGDHPVWQLTRPVDTASPRCRRIYISGGIHGDEPASTLAALRLLERDSWPASAEILLVPCLNPMGLAENRRDGPEGLDYNRDYRNPKTELVKAHLEWLRSQPRFDVALMLHEDWEADGFYLYELASCPDEAKADSIVRAVSRVCPVLQARVADGWPAENGVVRPKGDPAERPEWPEALYLFHEKADLCYTFEAPSDYPMDTRVAALVSAVTAVLSDMNCEGPP
jgi:hypothetical protein